MQHRIGSTWLALRAWTRSVAGAFAVLFCLANAPLAVAGEAEDRKAELATQFKALAIEVKGHKKAKDYEALDEDLTRARTLYEEASGDDKLRGQLVDLVGSIAKGCKSEVVAPFVLDALADMGDLRGAKYIKPYLKQRNLKVSSSLLQKAVAVSADVPDPSLVEPLLRIVEKSKTYGIAADAIESLARFGECKKKRRKILERLCKSIKKSKPGGRPGMRGGGGMDDGSGNMGNATAMGQEGGASARWNALARVLPSALNSLTGRDIHQAADWFELVRESKGKLALLFTED